MKKKFYQTQLFAILSLILFFPLGIYLMFKNNHFSKSIRIAITGLFAFILIVGIFAPKTQETTSANKPTEVVEETPKKETEPLTVEEIVKSIANDLLLEVNTNDHLVVKMKLPNGFNNSSSVTSSYLKAKAIIEKLLKNNYSFNTYQFWFTADLRNQYGNIENSKVLSFEYDNETIRKINFDNITTDNFKSLAKNSYIHPALK